MKAKWIKTIIGILMLIAAFSISVSAGGGQVKVRTGEAEMLLDGHPLPLPAGQHIFIHEGRTYIPLRFVSYALNKNVQWDNKEKVISVSGAAVSKNDNKPPVAGNNPPLKTEITVTPVAAGFIFNGEAKALPDKQSTYMYKGTTYVPIRFIMESLGIRFEWDKQSKQIKIESESESESESELETELESEGQTPQQGGNDDIGAGAGVEEQPAEGNVGGGGGTVGSPEGGIPSNGNGETDDKTDGNGETDDKTDGNSGGTAVKPSYETITADAEQRLSQLRSSCKSTLTDIGMRYLNAASEADRKKIIAEGKQELDDCTNRFNQILSEIEGLLTEHGYSAAIIDDYREQFDEEMALGRELL